MPRRHPHTPHPATTPTRAAAALALIATALALPACGGDDDTPTTTAPKTTTAEDDQSTTASPPPTGSGKGGVKLTEIGSFDQPVYVTQPPAGDDSLYVVEQTGRVQRVPAGGGDPEVFLDLSDQVSCCGEQGLLSIAFAPDYEKSGLLYASFTNTDGDSRVVEYQRAESGDVADPDSAREVLAIDQPYSNHNGGLALFGPDGYLYLGYGDGGSAGDPERRGQDLGTLLGKLLRIDPRPRRGSAYGIPPGNDFSDQPAPIYAFGLRNPWRFSFDRKTEDLWIGDVGQQELEEVDGVPAGAGNGANFGWSAYEGTERYNQDQAAPDAVDPVFTYSHDEGCSVTGGYVVRDPALRSLYGRYLYGDYCAGDLRSFTAQPGEPAGDDAKLGLNVPGLSSFGEDVAGHVYAVSVEGPVYRLDPAPDAG